MSISLSLISAVSPNSAKDRKPHFGTLVSAINRGDVEGAQNAFAALSALGPKAPGPLRKGALDAMQKALNEADLAEAKKALKSLQQANLSQSAMPSAATGLASGSTLNIMI